MASPLFPSSCMGKLVVRYVIVFLLVLGCGYDESVVVEAGGKGPTGLYAASDGRHLIVADSSLPGLLLVDLEFGETVERLDLTEKTKYKSVSPVGVATCGNCHYLFVSCNGGKYLAIYLADSVDNLLSQYGRLGFEDDAGDDVGVEIAVMRQFGRAPASDGRAVVMSSPAGKAVYVSDLNNSSVYVIRGVMYHKQKLLGGGQMDHNNHTQRAPKVRLVAKIGKRPSFPYGISWADGDKEEKRSNLWVTTHAGQIRKIDATTGETKDAINMVKLGCPETQGGDDDAFNMRTSLQVGSALLVLGNFPKTLEAALWRVNLKKRKCKMIFGGRAGHSDWVDGFGASVRFTRPHSLVLHPDKTTVILADIDNRALRLLNLTSGNSSSIMYGRDTLLRDREETYMRSSLSCNAAEDSEATGGAFSTRTPLGTSSMVLLPKTPKEARFSTFREAREYCETQGMRLCEPSELRRSRALRSSQIPSWTRAECAGCLQMDMNVKCETGILGDASAGSEGERNLLVENYLESWNSGYALEVATEQGTPPFESATVCWGPQEGEVVAQAVCCADC